MVASGLIHVIELRLTWHGEGQLASGPTLFGIHGKEQTKALRATKMMLLCDHSPVEIAFTRKKFILS